MKAFRLFGKWLRMLKGDSVFHVTQGKGKVYSTKKIKGYYNDLTNKVCNNTILDEKGIPYNITVTKEKVYFPITVFQYGLALYDLYLIEKNDKYLDDFLVIVEWSRMRQNNNGSWDCMGMLKNKIAKTQSSMCQGEGASLLLRAYIETKDKRYYESAKKAIDFMLEPVEKGGTTLYDGQDVIFEEYITSKNLAVLNGWIFSIFGLYDFILVNNSKKYKTRFNQTTKTLAKYLKKYDRGFWSDYDICGTIASPFYHNLHTSLLDVVTELTGDKSFARVSNKWQKYSGSRANRLKAMGLKFKQKLFENGLYDGNTGLVK